MGACKDHEQRLILDVFGELNSEERRNWEAHLQSCPGCFRERERLARILTEIRSAGTPPELTPAESAQMAASVKQRLQGERRAATFKRQGYWTRAIFRPAFAAAGLILVLSGFLGYTMKDRFADLSRWSKVTQESLPENQDREIVENLELLKEMETIQKLVNIVDKAGNGGGSEPRESEFHFQGMRRHDGGSGHA